MIPETSYLIDTSNPQLMAIIRSIDGDHAYDNGKHKSEYEKLADFVINYVQNEM